MSQSTAFTTTFTTNSSAPEPSSGLADQWGWFAAPAGIAGAAAVEYGLPQNVATNSMEMGLALVGLIGAAEIVGNAAKDYSRERNISGATTGLLLGFMSSFPELVVSASSLIKGEAEVSLGNVMGSNIANPLFALALPMLILGMKQADGSIENMDYDNRFMMASGAILPCVYAAHEMGLANLNVYTGSGMLALLTVWGAGKVRGWDKPKSEAVLERIGGQNIPQLSDTLIARLDEIFGDTVEQPFLDALAALQQQHDLDDDAIAKFYDLFLEAFDSMDRENGPKDSVSVNDLRQLEARLGVSVADEFAPFLDQARGVVDLDKLAAYMTGQVERVMTTDPVTDQTFDKLETILDIKISAEDRAVFEAKTSHTLAKMGIGTAALIAAAHFIVDGGIGTAEGLGVDKSLVGTIAVALGTSLPETAINFSSFMKKEYGQAFGNVLGSNIFNVLMIAGVSAIYLNGEIPEAFQLLAEDGSVNKLGALNSGFLLFSTLYMWNLTKNAKELVSKPGQARTAGFFGLGAYWAYAGLSYTLGG